MGPKILVVEDEDVLRFTFTEFLSDEGYEVEGADSYESAFALVNQAEYDIIFTDIVLGGTTGMELLQNIKQRGLNTQVIIITGYPNLETSRNAVKLGAYDYIPKPITRETLLQSAFLAARYKELLDREEKNYTNLQAIFDGVQDAIVTVTETLTVSALNRSASDICGFTQEIIGKSLFSRGMDCRGGCAVPLEESVKKHKPSKVYRIECGRKARANQVVSISVAPMVLKQKRNGGAVMIIRDETELAMLEEELDKRQGFYNIIGKSKKMQDVYSMINKVANVNSTVLITGENGTGKGLVAEALHYAGSRSKNRLVKVLCNTLPEGIIESELFGHVKGAFTGAISDKIGKFHFAQGGTVFLDEIAEFSPKMQLSLLRVLQDKEFERVGDTATIKVDVRIIAATNQDLLKKIKDGTYREDLYYRLKVIEIRLPPLRERLDDIRFLVRYFIEKFNREFNKEVNDLSYEVANIFMNYDWPGNVRELEHTIEHSVLVCSTSVITTKDLPLNFRTVSDRRDCLDQSVLLQTLKNTGGNKAKAARLLGVSRPFLYKKLREYKI